VNGNNSPAIAQIGGLSILKGLVLYGATLTFVGLYVYFMVEISGAQAGKPPTLDASLVSAAAALAGVLGSAFALMIGKPTNEASTNAGLRTALDEAKTDKDRALAWIRQVLSLEPSSTEKASWPMTFGIWAYALVASAVAITYILNESETPGTIKTLAVAFAGYVIALITAAYGITSNGK
jgi:hypothetical protein